MADEGKKYLILFFTKKHLKQYQILLFKGNTLFIFRARVQSFNNYSGCKSYATTLPGETDYFITNSRVNMWIL